MGSRQGVSLAEDADDSGPTQKANDDEDDAGVLNQCIRALGEAGLHAAVARLEHREQAEGQESKLSAALENWTVSAVESEHSTIGV